MNSTIKITATLKFLLLALLTGCPSSKDAIAPEPVQKVKEGRLRISPDALANIKLTKAEEIDFPETLGLMGKLSPTEDRTTVVPARVAGRIESVTVASGETVKQGQALATLFSPDFVSAKEEYAQSLTQAGTKASGNDFSNLSKLAKKRLQTMGLSESDIQNLAGETTKTEKNLVVRAPRSGALVSKTATVGNQVNAGDTLFTIADLSRMWFVGDLYPEDLPRVKKDQEIIIDGLAGTPPIFGKVSFISPVVDPTVRSIKVRALMENPNLSLRADMYLQGSLVINKTRALIIPSSSILHFQDKNFVFKKVESMDDRGAAGSMQVEKVVVEAGEEAHGKTPIRSGIHAGDFVVSDGALLLDAALNNSSEPK